MFESFLLNPAKRGLEATAEALFPVNAIGAPDYRTTDLVGRTLAYWEELPAPQRRLLMLLYVLVEWGAPLLGAGWGRFSTLPVAQREAAVRRFRGSRITLLRIVGDALKATTTILYMSHPAALAYIGAPSGGTRGNIVGLGLGRPSEKAVVP